MKKKINWTGLWQELAKKIKKYYPYFLVFYIAVLLFVVFFPSARAFFYWPGLHGAAIFLTVLAALAYSPPLSSVPRPVVRSSLRPQNHVQRVLLFFRSGARVIKIIFFLSASLRKFLFRLGHFLRLLSRPLWRFLVLLVARIYAFKRRDWLKILIIAAIVAFGLYRGINAWEFVVLFYAACSLVYVLDSRWSAGVALVFLAACPVLLISDREVLAENSAISAFYFLVITVLTQIRELHRDKKLEPEENNSTDNLEIKK